MISDAAVTAAILRWLRSRSSGASSPMGAILSIAELGTIVQTSGRESSPLDRLDAFIVRQCSPEQLMALAAKYMPEPPLTRWTTTVLYTRKDGAIVTEPREVARWRTDGELGTVLGVSAGKAREIVAQARACVRDALEVVEREHRAKCE